MTDKKIDSLTAITGANLAGNDEFVVVDVSDPTLDPTGTTKKITRAEMNRGVSWNAQTVPTDSGSWNTGGGTGTWTFSGGTIAQTDSTQTAAKIWTTAAVPTGVGFEIEFDARIDTADGGGNAGFQFGVGFDPTLGTSSGVQTLLSCGIGVQNAPSGFYDTTWSVQGQFIFGYFQDPLVPPPQVGDWHTYKVALSGSILVATADNGVVGTLSDPADTGAANPFWVVDNRLFLAADGAISFRNFVYRNVPIP